MRKFFKLMFISILFVLPYSCSDDDDPVFGVEDVKEAKVVDTLKVADIKKHYKEYLLAVGTPASEIDVMVNKFKYDIVLSVINYKVKDQSGDTRLLSGLVTYPVLPDAEKAKKLRIYAILHGTIYSDSEALSYITGSQSIGDPVLNFSAHESGYIGVFPDYFGYGSDNSNMHYYEHRATLATASRGMIDAIPAYAGQKSLHVDFDKLYITGYSEGGFAAMSTLRSYSESHSSFKDFVTIAGAGAYDKRNTLLNVLDGAGGSSEYIASYAWVLMTYNKVYNIDRDYNKLFKPACADILVKHEGKNTIFDSIDVLPDTPAELFAPEFVDGIKGNTDTPFINALNDNNVSDFDARGRVYLIHGDEDEWVPAFNTEFAYDRLEKRGVNVVKEMVSGGTHGYLTDFYWRSRFIKELDR